MVSRGSAAQRKEKNGNTLENKTTKQNLKSIEKRKHFSK